MVVPGATATAELDVYEAAEMRAPVGAGVDGVAGCDRALWSLELAGAEAAAAAFVNSLAPLESSAREAAPARIQLKEMEIFLVSSFRILFS